MPRSYKSHSKSKNKVTPDKLLIQTGTQLMKAGQWLKKSYTKVKKVRLSKKISDKDFESFEVFSSRFSRLADLLIKKFYKTIYIADLESSGTVLDTIHHAAKRRLLRDEQDMIAIRELCNAIVHEYEDEELIALFKEARHLTPALLDCVDRANSYLKNRSKVD